VEAKREQVMATLSRSPFDMGKWEIEAILEKHSDVQVLGAAERIEADWVGGKQIRSCRGLLRSILEGKKPGNSGGSKTKWDQHQMADSEKYNELITRLGGQEAAERFWIEMQIAKAIASEAKPPDALVNLWQRCETADMNELRTWPQLAQSAAAPF